MPPRNVYLKIEQIDDYSPVEPQDKPPPPIQYRRDEMRNAGQPDGTIPQAERDARAMTAIRAWPLGTETTHQLRL